MDKILIPMKIGPASGRCPFCPTRGSKEQPLFQLRSELFNGRLCGEHLHSLLNQQDEQPAPPNGQPAHEVV
jgi:hypothetical protein